MELDNTTQRVAPYAGAVVKVKYVSHRGTPVLINASFDGEPVAFGANVLDSAGNSVGSVGQAGQIYARVADEQGELRIKWADGPDGQCRVRYHLMPQAKGKAVESIQQFSATCTEAVSPSPSPKAMTASSATQNRTQS
ncbi:Outer membrane usher protein fimD precursor [Ewingella americana]|uniref:Outer membrane usher protein fimD n=1 Tax=Ewingella americana TaxID=41202 RepID=A0A377NDS6_9GAMM|nr:Outer membrane usher protein fimD precursor [Ewingella americana]